MRPAEWITMVLVRHGLEKPDGRPLYQYRITDDEFHELTSLLKLSANLGFQHISRMLMWDAAMVFYAAEWWRRYYSGQWSWEGIFDSLGIELDDVTTGRRNEVIELGLQRWQRKVRRINYRRQFLGTVATEGGLPLNRLNDTGGWLNGVLRPVIRKHLLRGIEIETLLDAYSDAIPQSYRSAEMSQILVDLVTCVTNIRKQYDFTEKLDPVAFLDKHDSHWRDAFPLPLESDVAKALLTDLIIEAAKVDAKQSQMSEGLFYLDRFLVKEATNPEVKAKLEMPAYIPLELLKQCHIENVPAKLDFELSNDKGERWTWCRGFRTVKQGVTVYKLAGKPLILNNEQALAELQLRVKSDGEILGELPISQAHRLVTDEPWLFRKVAERWELHGTASQKIKDDKALVYIPNNLDISQDDNCELNELQEAFDGKIYSLLGKVNCRDDDNSEMYELSTKAIESYLHYDLVGKIFDGVSVPGKVYIGLPGLIERNAITGFTTKKTVSTMKAKPLGISTPWKTLSVTAIGVFELRLLDHNGAILCKRRVGILPKDFDVSLEADRKDVRSGKVIISGLPGTVLTTQDDDIKAHNQYVENQYILSLVALGEPPRSLTLNILAAAQRHEMTLTVPFPSKGSVLYDPVCRLVRKGQSLFLSDLFGYRIKIFKDHRDHSNTAQIRFSLLDDRMAASDLRDVYINKTVRLIDTVTELALMDWKDVIEEMLGVSANLDASVRVSLVNHGQEELTINIQRYSCDLTVSWQEGTLTFDKKLLQNVSGEKLEKIQFDSIPLHQPEQSGVDILAIKSEGVETGVWDFQQSKRETGLWMVFPKANSSISFRPLLWAIRGDDDEGDFVHVESVDSLQKAIQIKDTEKRECALKLVMHQMSLDVKHKSWPYLEALHERTKHLPLATFDVWRMAVTEPEFLASLFVKEQFENVVERLVAELPIIWELVRIKDWEQALNSYKNYLCEVMCTGKPSVDESILQVIDQLVMKVISRIESLGSSMQSVCKIIKYSVLGIEDKELALFKLPFNMFLENDLKHNYQDLIRRNSDAEWLTMLQQSISDRFSYLPIEVISFVVPHHRFQYAATYLPGVLAARLYNNEDYGWLGSAVNIFKLEQLKIFDEEWFSSAFQVLSGWLYFHEKNNEQ